MRKYCGEYFCALESFTMRGIDKIDRARPTYLFRARNPVLYFYPNRAISP